MSNLEDLNGDTLFIFQNTGTLKGKCTKKLLITKGEGVSLATIITISSRLKELLDGFDNILDQNGPQTINKVRCRQFEFQVTFFFRTFLHHRIELQVLITKIYFLALTNASHVKKFERILILIDFSIIH
jgi:hypothetical protein